MTIERLELINFRNYSKKLFLDLKRINIIIGSNGIGKTSILEALYYLSLFRSFRSNNDENLIKKGEDFFRIKCTINNSIKNIKLECYSDTVNKVSKINGSLKKKISDYILQFKVVVFTSNDLNFIRETPSIRRNYINVALSQIHLDYIDLLKNYNKTLKYKNDYLKKVNITNKYDKEYLDVLDLKLSQYGSLIIKYRKDYIKLINPLIKKYFHNFNDGDLELMYKTNVSENVNVYFDILVKNRKSDIKLGYSKCGVHRDDFEFLYKKNNVNDFCSQGNQKLVMLSFKMAEINILNNNYYEEPIILLDDLFSELDQENQNKILKYLLKKFQVFITCTDINNVDNKIINNAKIIDLGGINNE